MYTTTYLHTNRPQITKKQNRNILPKWYGDIFIQLILANSEIYMYFFHFIAENIKSILY